MLRVFVQSTQNFYRMMITVHPDTGVPGKVPLVQRQHSVVPCGTDGLLSFTLLKSVSSNTRMIETAAVSA